MVYCECSEPEIVKFEGAGDVRDSLGVEPPTEFCACGEFFTDFVFWEVTAGAGVGLGDGAMGCGEGFPDVGAGAEAWVDEALGFQCLECLLVGSGSVGLEYGCFIPMEAQPLEV